MSRSIVTLRLPPSLKAAIDKAAKEQKVPLNTWIMRCLEKRAVVLERIEVGHER